MVNFTRFWRWLLRDTQTLADLPIPWGAREFLRGPIYWSKDRLPLGICCTGGTGTGKSRRILLPLLAPLLQLREKQDYDDAWAALIIDPKLTFVSKLLEAKRPFGNDFIVLDEKCPQSINILDSSVPSVRLAELIADSRYAGEKLSKSSGSAFFESNAITVLSFLIKLARLHQEKCLETVFEMLAVLQKGGDIEASNSEAQAVTEQLHQFLSGDPKEVRQILFSVYHLLQPFMEDPWRQIFAQKGNYLFRKARDEGAIMLARFSPQTPHLNAGLCLMKAMWFAAIMERLESNFRGNTTRLCLYVADEFQKVARPGSEATFFDVRREARGVPIVAFQQISQLEEVLGETETKTVLGLLSTKVALRNADPSTNEFYSHLCGEIDVVTESTTSSPGTWDRSQASYSTTQTLRRVPRIPPQFFTDLPDGDAVIFEAGSKPRYAWFRDALLTTKEEKKWRKTGWPSRPRLSKPPRFLR